MPASRGPSTASRGVARRKFLKLLAAGSAAALAGPARASSRSPRPAKPAKPAEPAALRTEIENQKRQFAQALEAIRTHRMPPGSDPAFVFTPLGPPETGRKAQR